MRILGGIFLTLILIPASILINGWVMSRIWLWFIAPTFDIRPLSIVEAIGVMTVISFSIHIPVKYDPEESYAVQMLSEMVGVLVRCAMVLSIGAVVKQFMP